MTMVRAARETDLSTIAEMIADFTKGHKAEYHPRSPQNLRTAYFGDRPVAHLLVAEHRERVIGMIQWSRFYDQFWSMFGVRGEWLYVRPDARGLGIAAVLVAEICELGRRDGAEFLQAGRDQRRHRATLCTRGDRRPVIRVLRLRRGVSHVRRSRRQACA